MSIAIVMVWQLTAVLLMVTALVSLAAIIAVIATGLFLAVLAPALDKFIDALLELED